MSVDQVFEQMSSARQGLSNEQAQRRLDQHGPNRIGEKKEVSPWAVLLHQFQSPLIYVLFGALAVTIMVSLTTQDTRWADAIVIGMVLVVNTTLGFLQEYRAEHAVEALMQMIAPRARVKRDDQGQQVEAEKIVPGDIVLLGEGDVVPADVRLFDTQSMQINESALTGESVPVSKQVEAMEDAEDNLPPNDQQNIAFMGTAVTSGHGEGIVIATAKDTQIGAISQQVEQAGQTQTPLQRRIQRLAIWITWGILAIAAVAFFVGLWMGQSWTQMITLAVALAVAAIPAGLPIVVTVALAIGVHRMAKREAVIRHLPAVDTLGSCTVIVSDKTGTLTQNRMGVAELYAQDQQYSFSGDVRSDEGRLLVDNEPVEAAQHPIAQQTLAIGLLCNDASLEEKHADPEADDNAEQPNNNEPYQATGDPMEQALLFGALKAGLDPDTLRQAYPRTDEIPFKTENRFMATIHDITDHDGPFTGEGPLVLIKGAPERILEMCASVRPAEGDVKLYEDAVMQQLQAMAGRGLRVLAMAMGNGDQAVESIHSDEPSEMTFLGLQGLIDPPRDTARQAVDQAHQAGIRVMMVTGDHARTGAAIAHQVHVDQPPRAGIFMDEDGDATEHSSDASPTAEEALPETTTGKDITELDDASLDNRLRRTNVFTRVKPTQKTRLVDRLKSMGEIVSVTGDGVNDAPALKTAHLGAAMGSGTDVAKQASDMVITDDHFASVYAAVEQGRTAFRNIRMATFFLLSTGAADVLIILSALVMGWPLPLLPAQILWCNVVTNGIADVALAFEPGEKALYRQPPRAPSEGILDARLLERLVIVGIWLTLGVLAMFMWSWGFNFEKWSGNEDQLTAARTAALTTLVLFQKVHVFNCRSQYVSIFKKSLLANKLLFIGVLTSLAVHIAAIYIPLTQDLLSLAPLDSSTWLWAGVVASTAIIVNELHKKYRPRKLHTEPQRDGKV